MVRSTASPWWAAEAAKKQLSYEPYARILEESLMQVDGKQRKANQARLLELARSKGDEVELICAHDPVELARYAA